MFCLARENQVRGVYTELFFADVVKYLVISERTSDS